VEKPEGQAVNVPKASERVDGKKAFFDDRRT
jgi:hypothetical protein